MIEILNKNSFAPYKVFYDFLETAQKNNQTAIDAICISSFNKNDNEVDARYVNLKYVDNQDWIFFSNYNGKKAQDFQSHSQINATLYWSSIDLQIRMKAKIRRTSKEFSDMHFQSRDIKKNALAIISNQSEQIKSYEEVVKRYNSFLNKKDNSKIVRPDHWGGFSFCPYYFEFWEGHESRINKREVFDKINGVWKHSFLQP
jgi:pyridoxamine 5'-phosphate oxidase